MPLEDTNAPIRFSAFEEFASRPRWEDAVDAGRHKPKRIIGDYSFPKSKEVKCGLKSCRHPHMNGYVIETDDGIETHIGNRCGRTHFGVMWGELHAVYSRAKEDRDREDWLIAVLGERDVLIQEAQSSLSAIVETTEQVRAVMERLQKEPDVFSSFMRAVRTGGSIQVERAIDSKTAEMMNVPHSQRISLEKIGHIMGLDAVPGDGASYPGDRAASLLRAKVIPALKALSATSLRNLNSRQRKERVKEIESVKGTLSDSQRHLLHAAAFLSPKNLRELGKLPVSRRSQRAERILKSFSSVTD